MGIVFLGDFLFSYPNDIKKDDLKSKQAEAEKKITDMMSIHYKFFGEFQKESQYVTSGSKLWCSAGTKLTVFDIPVDHAVVRPNGSPLGICSDCERNKNIYPFGGCSKPTPNGYPKRKTTVVSTTPSQIIEKEKCIPMLDKNKGWQQTKSTNLKVWDYTDNKFYNVITTGDYLTCFYGGLIRVIEASTPCYTLSANWRISPEGFQALKNHETNISTLKGWGIGEFDANNVLIGIYPHYVFRTNTTTGQWESDGGITLGFGHYVSQSEYQTDNAEKALVDKYANGAPLIPATIPSNGVSYSVPNSSYVTMNDVKEFLMLDVTDHEKELNKLIEKHNYPMTQTKFDALIDLRYHKYRLGNDIDKLLVAKSTDKVKWEAAIAALIGPKGDKQRESDLVDLFNNGVYPK